MSGEEWRLAASSVVGIGHVRRGIGCQDAHRWQLIEPGPGGPVLVTVLADGAGSAARSDAGAQLVTILIEKEITQLLAGGGSIRDIERERIGGWLAGLRAEIETLAVSESRLPREFSSTLLAAVIGEDCGAFFQVGDGAMVVAAPGPDAYECVFWPANDEYENITFFATETNALQHLECALLERRIDDLALFSDGLQRLALDYATRRPHTPFFESMLAPLRAAVGPHDALSAELATFLDSPRVNDRTDDDKTLMLATRRANNPPPH